jgi:hypothetical protein
MCEPQPLTALWAFTACYRDSFTLPLIAQVLLLRGNMLCVIHLYVTTIGAASPWGRKCITYGTRKCRSPTGYTDTGQWRCHNCSCGMRESWRNSSENAREFGSLHPISFEVHHNDQSYPSHYLSNAHLFPDNPPTNKILQMATHWQTADELFLSNTLWTDEVCFTFEGVFSVHESHVWARD